MGIRLRSQFEAVVMCEGVFIEKIKGHRSLLFTRSSFVDDCRRRLVLFRGSGSELLRGLGSVVLGGLLVSTVDTWLLDPTLFSLLREVKA